ncbi:MAG: hypothetical protein ACI4VW_04600 [Acutalibacteraceae bacterium]
MKRISKILSVLMVAVMLFSFAAVPASAADYPINNDAHFKFVFKDLEGNVITKAAKGDQVELFVCLNWDVNVLNFMCTFKWDKSALTLLRKNGSLSSITSTTQTYTLLGDFASATQIALSDADGDMYTQDDDNNMVGYYTTYGAGTKTLNHNYTVNMSEEMQAQYQAYTCVYGGNVDASTNQLMINTHGANLEFCKMRFLVNEDTTLTEAVISDDTTFDKANYIDIANEQEWYFTPYVGANCTTYRIYGETSTLQIGATPEVTHVKQQSKWNGGDDKNTAENYLFGFVGQFTGIDVTTTEVDGRQEVTNIQSITATATVNGGAAVVADVQTIWEVSGGYQFRAVFKGFAPTSSDEVSVVFAVTMSDGTTVYSSPAEVKVVNDIYTASVAAGLPAVA